MTIIMDRITVTAMASSGGPRGKSRGNNGGDRLLILLQLTNASFPTGAFTHSYGFESWIQDGSIASAGDAEVCSRDWLRFNIATCDAVAVVLSYRDAQHGNMVNLVEVDDQLDAIKLTRESRSASTMTGSALMTAGRDIFDLPQLAQFSEMARNGECRGHYAVAYGVLSSELGLSETEAVTTFLWSSFSGLVGVLQRLLPMKQSDAQRIIADAGSLIDQCAEIARTREIMSASFAALDTASMRHERLHTRLCIS